MFNILEIMYHKKKYRATTNQLIEERKIGFFLMKNHIMLQ